MTIPPLMKIPLCLNSFLNMLQQRIAGAKWLVIGIWLSCLAVCCGYLWSAEDIYAGTVKLQVFRAPHKHIGSVTSRNEASFIVRELELLVSEETLLPVVQKTKLSNRWGLNSDQEAIQRLAKMVTPTEERGTDLIKISVHSTNMNEAAELANAVAVSYQDLRNAAAGNSEREAHDLIQQGLDKEESILAQCIQDFVKAMRDFYHPVDLELQMALADKWLKFCETLSEEEVKKLLPAGMIADGYFRNCGHEELLPLACDHLIENRASPKQ
jgi:hypothetical protein